MMQTTVVKEFNAKAWKTALPTQQDIRKIAEGAMTMIKRRTAQGKDADDRNFEPYSPAYWEWKQSRGRSRAKHGGTSHVNLMFHGHMLQAMQIRSIPNGYELFFLPDQAMKAMAHQFGQGNLPQRKFFGLPDAEWKRLFDMVQQEIRRRIEAQS